MIARTITLAARFDPRDLEGRPDGGSREGGRGRLRVALTGEPGLLDQAGNERDNAEKDREADGEAEE